MKIWDGKFNSDTKLLSPSEIRRRVEAYKQAVIVMYCESVEVYKTAELSEAFGIEHGLGTSSARNMISEHKWLPEMQRARANGIIPARVKTNYHTCAW